MSWKSARLKEDLVSIFTRHGRFSSRSRPSSVSPPPFSFSLLLVGVSTVSPTLRGVLSSIGIARAEQETGIPTAPFHVAMPRKHVREMISGLAGVLSPSRYDDRSSRDIPPGPLSFSY